MQRRPNIAPIVVLLFALGLGACGGMKFVRSDGAVRYRALPMGSEVKLVGTDLELPQPVAQIGTMKFTVQGGEKADPSEVADKFRKHAARYGCDAVVALVAASRSKKSTRKKKQIGEGGKIGYVNEEYTLYYHDWQARCVRSNEAPGGLAEGTGQTAAMPANALPVVPVPRRARDRKPAKDANPIAERVWRKLAVYSHPYLTAWASQLKGPAPAEVEVLECLNELMVQISGPTGFWRKTVPIDWLGCQMDPASAECGKAVKAGRALAPYDRLQKSMARTTTGSAKGFLKGHASQIETYLDDVVPLQPSLSGMRTTSFYKTHFK